MLPVIQILLGGALAIIGGMLGAQYHARLAARAEKRERFRGIYHALLSAASTSRTFARTPLADALLDDGTLAVWWLGRQERELDELSDCFREARKHASWLDFESDLRSVEGRLRFSTLDWTFSNLQLIHARLLDSSDAVGFDDVLAAVQALEASAEDLARAIRQHMLELELPRPRPSPTAAVRRSAARPRRRPTALSRGRDLAFQPSSERNQRLARR